MTLNKMNSIAECETMLKDLELYALTSNPSSLVTLQQIFNNGFHFILEEPTKDK